jgi:hypothetical protein
MMDAIGVLGQMTAETPIPSTMPPAHASERMNVGDQEKAREVKREHGDDTTTGE